jgi:uncharacterized protein (DUF1697 family)
MITYVALVRGINVGGHKPIAMADLRALLARLGFTDARSLLQSGNLVFRSDARTASRLEALLETEAETRLELRAKFFVRSAVEWKTAVARNPFPEAAVRDPSHLVVFWLKTAPGPAAVQALRAAITGPEEVAVQGREAYVVYRIGVGQSRLTSTLIERTLGTDATGRNWNTVTKIDALAESTSPRGRGAAPCRAQGR